MGDIKWSQTHSNLRHTAPGQGEGYDSDFATWLVKSPLAMQVMIMAKLLTCQRVVTAA